MKVDHKEKLRKAQAADDATMLRHERPKQHAWRPIGNDWYYCNGCRAWRHKDVLEMMKWTH